MTYKKIDVLQHLIGYTFHNSNLLVQALTHKSASLNSISQRLEFLGDAILNLIVTIKIFEDYQDDNEGSLSQTRANMIKGATLIRIAKHFNLGSYIIYVKDIKSVTDNMLEDSMEAIIATIYLDNNRNLDLTSKVIHNWFKAIKLPTEKQDLNPKTVLQQKLQALTKQHPTYTLIDQDHSTNTFKVSLFIGPTLNKTYVLSLGNSRKDVEIELARRALKDVEIELARRALKDIC